MNLKNQQLIKVSVVVVIIAGLFGALSIITEGVGLATGKLFTISLSLIFFGITATISMISARKPENKTLGMAGIAVSGLTFLLIFVMIIGEIGNDLMLKLIFALFISSIALAHISLLHYFNLQNKYALYARITATVAIAFFSLFINIQVFSPIPNLNSIAGNQSSYKVIIGALIIDLAATLLVPLCNRLEINKPTELNLIEPEAPSDINNQKAVE